jgi:hypothetical protein
MGSKKRRVRKTRRIKGGGNQVEGNPIESAIRMVDNLKEILVKMNQPKEEVEVQTVAPAEVDTSTNP